MKRFLVFVVLFITTVTLSLGQTSVDSVSMKKVFGGYEFYHSNKKLSVSQLAEVMKPNEMAYAEIKKAQSSYAMANVLGFAGGFMVGWPLGTALGGGEPNWTLAGVGAGLILVSIPISKSFNSKAKHAVDTYNGSLSTTSFWEDNELKLSLTGSGLGVCLNF